MRRIKWINIALCLLPLLSAAQIGQVVSWQKTADQFTLTAEGVTVPIVTDAGDAPGVARAVANLRKDFERVTTKPATVVTALPSSGEGIVLIGTVGHNQLIDQLISQGRLNGSELKDKNEKFLIETLTEPFPGIKEALVIAGSDRRGTIYGVYELSRQIGVSPWYYWADAPVKQQTNLYVKRGKYTEGEPAVRYRGIFINDEAPAFQGWCEEKFGGVNSRMYEHMFELILRLKGNFLWPAMWGNAFFDDDPLNGPLADEMGIVIGTTHHEPMGRAHDEWRRYGTGEWNYEKNPRVLQEFWQGGMERMKDLETLVTVGMRGDGDEAMSEGTNIALLEKIVRDQRKIIQKVTGKKASETPQVWALYKEVQDYYDRGMRVPDDVTLLLCDDNWGNVRKLPELDAKPRKGGYGMYYHFDYVGGPRNSKWLNISPVSRVWEQMNLTYCYGVKELWVVNVGDLKPMEYPIQFFLDMAWDPDRFNETNLEQHTVEFCASLFGAEQAKEAARLINTYSKYNRRVTPELLDAKTYSLDHYDEFRRVRDEYKELLLDAMKLNYLLPEEAKDTYDQLVLFPIHACANLYEMYYAVAKNQQLAAKNDEEANVWADRAKACFERDSLLTLHYHRDIAGGKWNHIMSQTHIGYTYWQQPPYNVMPKVEYVPTGQDTPRTPVFIEKDGYVSIEAPNYSRAVQNGNATWIVIPDLGKTLGAVTTTPVTVQPQGETYLEYDVELTSEGEAKIEIYFSPTLNFNGNRGLRYAVSLDGEAEQVVNINGHYRGELGQWQAEAIIRTQTRHTIPKPGRYTLRFRALDPGIVVQKIVVDLGGVRPSYLGPPQSEIKR